MWVTAQPASSLSKVTVAFVSSFSGVNPALPNCAESAIVKQLAWAAAINSSGFVPFPFSKRVPNEYCWLVKTPLSVDTVPFPFFSSPCQTDDPQRFIRFPPVEISVRCPHRQSDKGFRPAILWTGNVRPWVWDKPVTVRHLDSRKGDGIKHRILGDDAVLME